MSEQTAASSIQPTENAVDVPALTVELIKHFENYQGIETKTLFQITKAIWLGEGLFGRVFSATGFVIREGRAKPAALALKIFLRQFKEDPLYKEVDIDKYAFTHAELQRRGLPTFSTLRLIKAGEGVIGFAMTDLTTAGDTIFSINEPAWTREDLKERDPERWEKLQRIITDDAKCEMLRILLTNCAREAAKQNVAFNKPDPFFIVLNPEGKMRILIGDLDNVTARSQDRQSDTILSTNLEAVNSFMNMFLSKRKFFESL